MTIFAGISFERWTGGVAAIAAVGSAIYAGLATKDARYQNSRQERMSRVALAQEITAELSNDELL
jgi:hypothetical protein